MSNEAFVNGLTWGQIEEAVRIFKCMDGTGVPTEMFEQIARFFVGVNHETVILRCSEGKVELLLLPRPSNDGIWTNMVASPGGGERPIYYRRYPYDPRQGVFKRVQDHELGIAFDKPPMFITTIRGTGDRGSEHVDIHLCSIPADAQLPEGAIWVDIDSLLTLPNFILGQLSSVRIAAEYFKMITGARFTQKTEKIFPSTGFRSLAVIHETVIARFNDEAVEVLLVPGKGGYKSLRISPRYKELPRDYQRNPSDPRQSVYERVMRELGIRFIDVPEQLTAVRCIGVGGPEYTHIDLCRIPSDSSLPVGAEWVCVDELLNVPNFPQWQKSPIVIAAEVAKIKNDIGLRRE